MTTVAPLQIQYIKDTRRKERSPEESFAFKVARAGNKRLLEASDLISPKLCKAPKREARKALCARFAGNDLANLRTELLVQAAKRHPRYVELQGRWPQRMDAHSLATLMTQFAPNVGSAHAMLFEVIDAILDCPALAKERNVAQVRAWAITFIALRDARIAHDTWVQSSKNPIPGVQMDEFGALLEKAMREGRLRVRAMTVMKGAGAQYTSALNRIGLPEKLLSQASELLPEQVQVLYRSVLHELFHAWEDAKRATPRLISAEVRAHIFGEQCALIAFGDSEHLQRALEQEVDQFGQEALAGTKRLEQSFKRNGLRKLSSLMAWDLVLATRGSLAFRIIERDLAAKELAAGALLDRTALRDAYIVRRLVDFSGTKLVESLKALIESVIGNPTERMFQGVLRRRLPSMAQVDAGVRRLRQQLIQDNATQSDVRKPGLLNQYLSAHVMAFIARYAHDDIAEARRYLREEIAAFHREPAVRDFMDRLILINDGL